jgi:energy-coupling factor transporter ATP-binding protein EcfA2
MAKLILSRTSEVYKALESAAKSKRRVFLAGLSGVGKSLLLQQLALIASQQGRTLHLLQWDVARGSFETPKVLRRYPEINGVTHPAIRQGVGLWARAGVFKWEREYPDPLHLLLGETPLIGNRLLELARQSEDAVEPALAGDSTLFLIPAPSRAVRAAIEGSRDHEMTVPRHDRERANASLALVRAHWREIRGVAEELGTSEGPVSDVYTPEVYVGVYRHVLRNRHSEVLPISTIFNVEGSAQEMPRVESELSATPAEVDAIMSTLARFTDAELAVAADGWFC